MSYSIIPPIALILSLIGIIIFLSRRASKIALLEDSSRIGSRNEQAFPGKRTFWSRIFFWSNGEGGGLKHGFLFFLEKFTRKLRIFFLKFENLFTHWSESIRKKRKDYIESAASEERNDETGRLEANPDIIERVRMHGEGNVYVRRGAEENNARLAEKRLDEKKIIRPIISDKVITPRVKPEIKNRLERILIERIAANPKDTEAYERLGEYYFEIENYQHSKECFKQVIKLDPMNVNVKDKMKRLERLLARR